MQKLSKLIWLGVVGAVIVAFFGLGGAQKVKDLIPEDLKKSVSDAIQGDSKDKIETKSDDLIPESANKEETKELTEKIKLTPEQEKSLPSNTDSARLSQLETNTQIPKGLGTLTEQETVNLTKDQQKAARELRELTIPQNIKRDTSLAGAVKTTGTQLKREEPVRITDAKKNLTEKSSTLQKTIVIEQERAQKTSLALFGDVSNPKFVKDAENFDRNANTRTTSQKLKEDNAKKLANNLRINAAILASQKRTKALKEKNK